MQTRSGSRRRAVRLNTTSGRVLGVDTQPEFVEPAAAGVHVSASCGARAVSLTPDAAAVGSATAFARFDKAGECEGGDLAITRRSALVDSKRRLIIETF